MVPASSASGASSPRRGAGDSVISRSGRSQTSLPWSTSRPTSPLRGPLPFVPRPVRRSKPSRYEVFGFVCGVCGCQWLPGHPLHQLPPAPPAPSGAANVNAFSLKYSPMKNFYRGDTFVPTLLVDVVQRPVGNPFDNPRRIRLGDKQEAAITAVARLYLD